MAVGLPPVERLITPKIARHIEVRVHQTAGGVNTEEGPPLETYAIIKTMLEEAFIYRKVIDKVTYVEMRAKVIEDRLSQKSSCGKPKATRSK